MVFHKGKPLYFQLLVCAVGCYALGMVELTVITVCFPNSSSIFGTPALFPFSSAPRKFTPENAAGKCSLCLS